MDGDAGVVSGWQNKLQVALPKVMPETLLRVSRRSRALQARQLRPGTNDIHPNRQEKFNDT